MRYIYHWNLARKLSTSKYRHKTGSKLTDSSLKILRYSFWFLQDSMCFDILVNLETYGKYIARDWWKIMPRGFPETRVVTENEKINQIEGTLMQIVQ